MYHKLHNTKQNKISDQKKTRLKHSSQRKPFAGEETNRSKLGWKGKHTRKQINSGNNQPYILFEKKILAQLDFGKEKEISEIDHFTVSCLVAWPLNESEAGGDLVLIETYLLFSC